MLSCGERNIQSSPKLISKKISDFKATKSCRNKCRMEASTCLIKESFDGSMNSHASGKLIKSLVYSQTIHLDSVPNGQGASSAKSLLLVSR